MLSVTLRQLEYAVAVEQHRGVSAAAEALHVSQPALSTAIAQLEGHLGQSLFIRRKGASCVPTAFGRGFLDDAARLLADVGNLVDPDGYRAESRRPVTIGCFEDLAPLILAPMLLRLRELRPETPIITRVGGFEMVSEQMLLGQMDFAITYDLGLDDRFARHQVAMVRPHAIVAADHKFASLDSVSLSQLATEPLILADQDLSIRHMIDLFRQRGLTPEIVHRAASLEIMRSLAGNGFGVGLSYTRPQTGQSYDGKALVLLDLADRRIAEPVIVASLAVNGLTGFAEALIEVVSALNIRQ
ncbi:MAG TPA: LysR family transcriptional regulator [Acidiphilium sp.]